MQAKKKLQPLLQKIKELKLWLKKLKLLSRLLKALVFAAAVITFAALIFLIVYILVNGVPYLKPSLFALEYNSDNVSMLPSILNTLMMTALALVIAAPLGIFTAIYLVEYAGRGNKLVELVRLTSETLSGIPSIVYGLFGMLFFVTRLHWDMSLLAGALTISMMILPLVIRTTEEALIAVPDMYREASYGLGAGRLRTVFRIVLPSAIPGILAGIILAIGRIVGETAALMYTAGTVAKTATGLFDSTRTLAVHMYLLSSEGFHTNEAYATAVVLLIIVLGINILSNLAAKRLTKG
ncbi:MAG: phosphate ABC transporter permease PstA [Clostridiaceae bacterium]|nr:phosphate ABC transporter permease PstA [Clostridiaceae bacterium]